MTPLSDSARRGPNFRNRGYSPTLGQFLGQSPLAFDGSDTNFYRYVRNSPVDQTDPKGLESTKSQAPAEKVVQDWAKKKSSFTATVKRWCGNCFKIRIEIEYEERQIERNGRLFTQWRDLKYTQYSLGEKVSCTGKEIGVLTAPGKWQSFRPPWQPSGEVPAPLPEAGGQTNLFGEAAPAGTEAPGGAYAPQMLGD